MSHATTEQTLTFRESFDILSRNAETLRNQDDPDIDQLLSLVNQSVSAYKVCRMRLDAVSAALSDALKEVENISGQA